MKPFENVPEHLTSHLFALDVRRPPVFLGKDPGFDSKILLEKGTFTPEAGQPIGISLLDGRPLYENKQPPSEGFFNGRTVMEDGVFIPPSEAQ